MKLEYDTPAGISIRLSRSNLENLLKRLNARDPALYALPYLVKEVVDQEGETRTLTVLAEYDESHYRDSPVKSHLPLLEFFMDRGFDPMGGIRLEDWIVENWPETKDTP